MSTKISLERLISFVTELSKATNDVDGSPSNDNKTLYNNIDANNTNDTNYTNNTNNTNNTNDLNDLPIKLKAYCEPYISDYHRLKVITTFKNENEEGEAISLNISLYSSILTCIDKQYINMSQNDKYKYVDEFVSIIKQKFNVLFTIYNYKQLKWIKRNIVNEINNYTNHNIIIQLLADFLHLSIFIFNCNSQIVSVCYTEKQFNIYKPSIFLLLKNNYFEPIVTNDKHLFWTTDPLFDFLTNNKKSELYILNSHCKEVLDKTFEIGLDEIKLEEDEEDKEHVDTNDNADNKSEHNSFVQETLGVNIQNNDSGNNSDDNSDVNSDVNSDDSASNKNCIFIKKHSKIKNIKVDNKMKLDELQKIAKSLKISLYDGEYKNGSKKPKSKTDLYNEINKQVTCVKTSK